VRGSIAEADDVATTLKSILVDEMELGLDAGQVTATVPLLEDGLNLDSIVIVELISVVEHRFGFEFQDEDLRTSSFENLEALAQVIEKRTVAPAGGSGRNE
jgi:acyl carrier protein